MTGKQGPDVLWCDFGGVLTPPLDEAVASIERIFGVRWPELFDAADRVARRSGSRGLGPLELGRMSQSQWAQAVTAELPGGVPHGSLETFGEAWYAGRGVVDPTMVALLRRARADGIRVGLLTNSVLEWEPLRRPMLEPAAGVFEATLKSHELGIAKPDPAIFAAADRLLPPLRGAVLIDDIEANCEAARRHGWSAVLHVDAASTMRELEALAPALGSA